MYGRPIGNASPAVYGTRARDDVRDGVVGGTVEVLLEVALAEEQTNHSFTVSSCQSWPSLSIQSKLLGSFSLHPSLDELVRGHLLALPVSL